jgi:CRISPR-associated protein Csm2
MPGPNYNKRGPQQRPGSNPGRTQPPSGGGDSAAIDMKRIFSDDGMAYMVEEAEKLGKDLAGTNGNGMTTSQIRAVFGSVARMRMSGFNADELIMLKPRLAYAAGRLRGKREGPPVEKFATIMQRAVTEVGRDEKKFDRFYNFFEAVLAYHKANGGK